MNTNQPTRIDVDTDGAIAESAAKVAESEALEEAAAKGDTRAQVLRKAALAGGGLLGGGALLGLPTLGRAADTRSRRQDVEILNFALTLEYLEAEFYAEAVRGNALSGDVLDFARTVGAHEAAHVEFLQGALGRSAVAKPSFDFKGTTGDGGRFIATARQLEETGVAAYIGQAYRLKSTANILVASHVLAVEARHAAWVRTFIPGVRPSEDAFEGSTFQNGFPRGGYATMPQVLAAVRQTGFITG